MEVGVEVHAVATIAEGLGLCLVGEAATPGRSVVSG
jgi:hypothetical protein